VYASPRLVDVDLRESTRPESGCVNAGCCAVGRGWYCWRASRGSKWERLRERRRGREGGREFSPRRLATRSGTLWGRRAANKQLVFSALKIRARLSRRLPALKKTRVLLSPGNRAKVLNRSSRRPSTSHLGDVPDDRGRVEVIIDVGIHTRGATPWDVF